MQENLKLASKQFVRGCEDGHSTCPVSDAHPALVSQAGASGLGVASGKVKFPPPVLIKRHTHAETSGT